MITALLCSLAWAGVPVINRVHTGVSAGWSWQSHVEVDVWVEHVFPLPFSLSVQTSAGVWDPWPRRSAWGWGEVEAGYAVPYANGRILFGYTAEKEWYGASAYFASPMLTLDSAGATWWGGGEFLGVGRFRVAGTAWFYASLGDVVVTRPFTSRTVELGYTFRW